MQNRPNSPRPFSVVWWVVLVGLGTVLSLFAPAYAFELTRQLDAPAWMSYPVMVLAGAVMGLILGATQAAALHGTVLTVRRAAWTLATAAGATISWALGMLPTTLDALGEPLVLSEDHLALGAVGGAVALVVAVPSLQWLLLRRVARGAEFWPPLSITGAVLGVGIAWLGSRAIDLSSAESALTGALILVVLLGLTFALVTGFGMRHIASRTTSA